MYLCSVVHNYNTTPIFQTDSFTLKMSIKTSVLIIAAALTAITANAQLLWKVTSPDTDKTSYLLGTHHLAPASTLDSIAGFNEALASVEAVYGELDMAEALAPEGAAEKQRALIAPADSTLSSLYTAAQLDSIDTLLKSYISPAMSVAAVDMLKPAAVTTMLSVAMSQKECGLPLSTSIDETVQNLGRAAGKRIGGLETLGRQIDIVFNSPIALQADGLLKIARNTGLYAESARSLYTAYRQGDLGAIMRLMTAPVTGMDDEEAEELLNGRNRAWVEFLVGAFPMASMMVVVGAGHLGGDSGVIELLRHKGFSVEPVETAPQLN